MNVFVTGGSRGIGRAIVLKMAKEGWGCAFSYVNDRAAAEETLSLARAVSPAAVTQQPPPQLKFYQMDCTSSAGVEKTAEQAIADFGDIHALVNNAGIVRNNAAVLMSDAEWNDVIATNLSGTFYAVRSFLMHFISNRSGRIISISSLAAGGSSGQINYSASKAGLVGLTKTLAKEYGSKGITSNLVTVGYVETDMTRNHMADSLREFWLKFCPLRKVGNAEDVANAVAFLASDQGAFINGEELRVAGGLTYAP
jgi:3-oxoacyl-[acyl-carrier protein] reductase